MKNLYSLLSLLTILCFQGHFISYGQTYTGNVTLFTQAQVDSFGALGYTRIDGSIKIGDPNSTQPNNITSLQPLLGLSKVDTGLFIANCSMNNLSGLDSMESISVLDLMSNSNLQSIESLSKIDTLYNLWISFNASLSNLNGLNQLKVIESHCDIYINNALQSVDGLNQLSSVGGFLRIAQNENLSSLEALGELVSITGDLNLAQNELLENLNGLENLNSTYTLDINNNPLLVDYCALSNLVDNAGINGDYYAYSNPYNPTLMMLENGACNASINVSEIDHVNGMTLLPNPTSGNITINFGTFKNNSIQIINALGQIIYSKNDIDLPNFNLNIDAPQGLYNVVVSSKHKRQTFKVVKQ